MRYIFTQLKDLPRSPAGTVVKCIGIERRLDYNLLTYRPYYIISRVDERGINCIEYAEVGNSVYDNSEWYKREIDYESLADLRCPKCGGTKGTFFAKCSHEADIDSDRYGVQFSVGFECICGHKRIMYGTHYGNMDLQKDIDEGLT